MSVCVLGSINLDIVLRVESLPRAGQTIAAHSLAEYPGGKGANQAVAAARLGVATRLLGAVGGDAAGRWLRDYLASTGVDIAQVREFADRSTGQAHILVSDQGENVIVVVGGANQAVSAAAVGNADLGEARVLLAQLETPIAAIAALFASPGAQGRLKLLNAAPALPAGRALFALADIIVVNETELADYAGSPAKADPAVGARRLITRAEQWVVVTLGAAGALAVSAAEQFATPGRAARVVDTTGAGDCFCGALAARLSEGAALSRAMEFANAAAAISVGRPGAASSMPTRGEVEAMLII